VSTSESVYVASDVHFGAAPPEHQSAFLDWLTHAAEHASSILVNGDLFDFWFEYRTGITRGHDSLLTALREVIDSGTPITLMGGNHDWWGGRYLTDEIGLEFLAAPVTRVLAGHEVHVAHGDGLGAGDLAYRALKRVLRSRLTRFSYGLLPVSVGDRIARGVSSTEDRWDQWGAGQVRRSDALEEWAMETLARQQELDVVLLGHTHLPLIRQAAPGRWYVNSGDWVFHQSYVILEVDEPPRLLDWRER